MTGILARLIPGRIRCAYSGHVLELQAWDFRARVELWTCARCPWARQITRRLGDSDRLPPLNNAGHREAIDFGLAVAAVVVVAVAIAFAGGSRGIR